jgi:hypothetical protein
VLRGFLHGARVPTVTCAKELQTPFTETIQPTGARKGFAR